MVVFLNGEKQLFLFSWKFYAGVSFSGVPPTWRSSLSSLKKHQKGVPARTSTWVCLFGRPLANSGFRLVSRRKANKQEQLPSKSRQTHPYMLLSTCLKTPQTGLPPKTSIYFQWLSQCFFFLALVVGERGRPGEGAGSNAP